MTQKAEYGVIGAGTLGKSLIGQLARKPRQIGPVVGVSFRVASRMANSLRAGYAARSAGELNSAPAVLFHAPADQVRSIAALLEAAPIGWKDKPLIFCDCEVPAPVIDRFHALGASTASARQFGVAGTIMVEGTQPSLACAHRIAGELRLSAIEIAPGASDTFDAALTLATGALTPLINRAVGLLRACGLRDKDAVQLATALFSQTVQEYGHSGRQSWTWHVREPNVEQIEAEIAAVVEPFRDLFRQLIVTGLDHLEKHPAVSFALRNRDRRDAAVSGEEAS